MTALASTLSSVTSRALVRDECRNELVVRDKVGARDVVDVDAHTRAGRMRNEFVVMSSRALAREGCRNELIPWLIRLENGVAG